MKWLQRLITLLTRIFNGVACFSLLLMMVLICTNIITRIAGKPITGTVEIVEVLLVTIIAFSLAYGSLTRSHISVDLAIRRLPSTIGVLLDLVMTFVSVVIFALLSWRSLVLAARLKETGEVSQTLWIPHFPLLWAFGVNCILAGLVLLVMDVPNLLKDMEK